MKKPWKLASNNADFHCCFQGAHVFRGHEHAECRGADAKLSELYNEHFARVVIASGIACVCPACVRVALLPLLPATLSMCLEREGISVSARASKQVAWFTPLHVPFASMTTQAAHLASKRAFAATMSHEAQRALQSQFWLASIALVCRTQSGNTAALQRRTAEAVSSARPANTAAAITPWHLIVCACTGQQAGESLAARRKLRPAQVWLHLRCPLGRGASGPTCGSSHPGGRTAHQPRT
jgi:hypothetical protein